MTRLIYSPELLGRRHVRRLQHFSSHHHTSSRKTNAIGLFDLQAKVRGFLLGLPCAYQDFLTLWKDADPDIPVLQQAKVEYVKLK